MNSRRSGSLKSVFTKIGVGILLSACLAAGARLYAINARESVNKAKSESAKKSEEDKKLDQVKIWRIFPLPLKDTLKLPGTLEAYEDVDLAVKIAGAVEWLGPREGDSVKAGEKLLQLNIDTLQAEMEQAEANVSLAQANFNRVSSLFKKNVASAEEYESNETELKTAKAALAQAKARLEDGTLSSPLDGIVDRKHIDQGEHVSAGQTVLKIVDISRVKVLVNVPEKDALYFKSGQEASIVASGNGEERTLKGKIEWMALTAEPATRTYPLKIVVDNSERELRPGMIVRVELVRRNLPQAIAIPFFSIVDHETSKSVFVIKENIAQERLITYGVFKDGLVEILEGLKPGDALVVVGQRNLVNGEKVEVAQDLTAMARQYLQSGAELSRLVMDQPQLAESFN